MSDSNRNVVDFKNARKRTTDKSSGKSRSGASGNGRDGYGRALRGQKGIKGSSSRVQWFHYVQVIALLLLVAWMMRSCNM